MDRADSHLAGRTATLSQECGECNQYVWRAFRFLVGSALTRMRHSLYAAAFGQGRVQNSCHALSSPLARAIGAGARVTAGLLAGTGRGLASDCATGRLAGRRRLTEWE
jgi:hypothetical protein